MVSFNQRGFFTQAQTACLCACLCVFLSACKFTPLYKEGSLALGLQGQVEIELVKGRNGFELREQLENRLGYAHEGAPYILSFSLEIVKRGLAVTEGEGTTLTNLAGAAEFIVRRKDNEKIVYQGRVKNITSFGSTSATYPSRVAEQDANIRLVKALAEQISNQLAIAPDGWSG